MGFYYSLSGWEDGQLVHQARVQQLDRWAVQAADSVQLHFDGPESQLGTIELFQDPHSPELGTHLPHGRCIFCVIIT
jgi:hypothetical protein